MESTEFKSRIVIDVGYSTPAGIERTKELLDWMRGGRKDQQSEGLGEEKKEGGKEGRGEGNRKACGKGGEVRDGGDRGGGGKGGRDKDDGRGVYCTSEENELREMVLEHLDRVVGEVFGVKSIGKTEKTGGGKEGKEGFTWANAVRGGRGERDKVVEGEAGITTTTITAAAATTKATTPPPPKPVIIPFGSYALSVHSRGSDLDILCLAPPLGGGITPMSREVFFDRLESRLTKEVGVWVVKEVTNLKHAFTPVIKFQVCGVSVDMVYAQISEGYTGSICSVVWGKGGGSEVVCRGMDERGIRSVNGVRVTQHVLGCVEDRRDTFEVVLRAVKEWGRRRGVYGNVLGFLGGINWAILTAFAVQRYPNKSPAEVLEGFFKIWGSWEWPNPVLLGPVVRERPEGWGGGNPWNPVCNKRDGMQVRGEKNERKTGGCRGWRGCPMVNFLCHDKPFTLTRRFAPLLAPLLAPLFAFASS